MPARIITSPRTLTRPRRRLWKHHSDPTFSHINWYLKKIFLFVTYTIIQSITSSEICALHLTHPSAHTPGAVDSQHCGSRGAVGGSVPLLKGLTSVVDNSCRSRDSNPQPRVTSPTLYPLGQHCTISPLFTVASSLKLLCIWTQRTAECDEDSADHY